MCISIYCHIYLVTKTPTPSPLISSTIFPTSSTSFFSSSIVTPTPTVSPGKQAI